jgi:transposase
MDRYIGIDVHTKSCTVAVVDGTGKRVGQHVVETNGAALVECLKMIPGERHVCMEEGTQSAWLYEILTPHAKDLAVVNVTESRGPKDDERDAFGLPRAAHRGDRAPGVQGSGSLSQAARARSRAHDGGQGLGPGPEPDQKLHAVTRGRGDGHDCVWSRGPRGVHEKAARGDAAGGHDALRPVRCPEGHTQAGRERTRVRGTSASHGRDPRNLPWHRSDPCGADAADRSHAAPVPDSAAVLVVLGPGYRDAFLGGLGAGPGGKLAALPGTKDARLEPLHNHQLKAIFKGAATTVIMQVHDDPLYQDFERLTAGGTKPNLAKVTLARKIAAIVLAMWKKEEVYDSDKHRKPNSE